MPYYYGPARRRGQAPAEDVVVARFAGAFGSYSGQGVTRAVGFPEGEVEDGCSGNADYEAFVDSEGLGLIAFSGSEALDGAFKHERFGRTGGYRGLRECYCCGGIEWIADKGGELLVALR